MQRKNITQKEKADSSNSSVKGTFESLLANYRNEVQEQLISATFEKMKLLKE